MSYPPNAVPINQTSGLLDDLFGAGEAEVRDAVLQEYRQQLRPSLPYFRHAGNVAGHELAVSFAQAAGAQPPAPPPDTNAQPPQQQWVRGFSDPVVMEFREGVLETAAPVIQSTVGGITFKAVLIGGVLGWLAHQQWAKRK